MLGSYDNYQPGEYYENRMMPPSPPPYPSSSLDESDGDYWLDDSPTPYNRRDAMWDNQQQRAYRGGSRFNRDPQWPQNQSTGRTRDIGGFYGSGVQDNYFDVDATAQTRFKSQAGYKTEDFRSGSPSSSSVSTRSGGYGREIGFRPRQQQQQPQQQYYGGGQNSSDRQQQRRGSRGYDDPQPTSSFQRGSNIGEEYTNNFRQGSASRVGYNRYRDDRQIQSSQRQDGNEFGQREVQSDRLDYLEESESRRQRQQPRQRNEYQDQGRRQYQRGYGQTRYDVDEEFSSFGDETQLRPSPSYERQRSMENFEPGSSRERYEGRGSIHDEPRSPPIQPRTTGQWPQREDSFRRSRSMGDNDQGWQGTYDYDRQTQSTQQFEERDRFGGMERPRDSFDQRRSQPYSRPNADFVRDEPSEFERPQRNRGATRRTPPQSQQQQYGYPPPGSINECTRDESFGYGGIKRMVNRLMNPYAAFGAMDRMMDRVNSEMARSMAVEKRSTKALLAEARDYLLADPAVRTLFGTNLELGTPFSKSQSSSMINGLTQSRLQLGIPVSGSEGTGRIRLVANQDGITNLEVEAQGRIINIPLDKRRRNGVDAIDADVVDIDVY